MRLSRAVAFLLDHHLSGVPLRGLIDDEGVAFRKSLIRETRQIICEYFVEMIKCGF